MQHEIEFDEKVDGAGEQVKVKTPMSPNLTQGCLSLN